MVSLARIVCFAVGPYNGLPTPPFFCPSAPIDSRLPPPQFPTTLHRHRACNGSHSSPRSCFLPSIFRVVTVYPIYRQTQTQNCFLQKVFKKAVRLQARQSLVAVFASNTNPSNQNSLEEKSDGSKTSDAGQGPPFLTILAGFLVFSLICWIIGSILTWLIGLIAHLLPSK